jgi:hypothetical protein
VTVRVVVGKQEGFVSSVGLIVEGGMPFLCRGKSATALHWEPASVRQQAVTELRLLIGYLKSAGVVVENEQVLDEVK